MCILHKCYLNSEILHPVAKKKKKINKLKKILYKKYLWMVGSIFFPKQILLYKLWEIKNTYNILISLILEKPSSHPLTCELISK